LTYPIELWLDTPMASHHTPASKAVRQTFATPAKATAAHHLMQGVKPELRGMLLLALAVGEGDGPGAEAFRSLAARIIMREE